MQTRFIGLFIGLALAPFAWPVPAAPQIAVVPGSAARGAVLVREKSCVQCHTFDGSGQGRTPSQLAAALWNHSPKMWQAQTSRNFKPVLNSAEAADLFAYFFSLSYFRAPGDPVRGEIVFERKTCIRCHDTTIAGRRPGPPISTWTEVDDPLAWAERMWNHSDKVHADVSSRGQAWPEFSVGEMLDLLAYLRGVPSSRSQTATFQPGDAQKGLAVFEINCESCHSFGNRTADEKIDLLKKPAPDVLTGYVTAMWNHAPMMRKRAGDRFPILGPGDMSDLVAYLFAQRYFYGDGDAARGARVFQEKSCASCHEQRRAQTGAPDLTAATERYSPITIAAALFRHGPGMLEIMAKESVTWPQFKPAEMTDLIAYLNSRLVARLAEP